MAVPYTFGSATSSIPLSQLDSNFATGITLGNTTVYLGNTTTSFGNVTLTNVTISSVAAAITPSQGGTGLVTIPANNVILGNGTSNVTVVAPGTSGNVLTSNGTTWSSSTISAASVSAAGSTTQVQYNNGGAFAGSANLTFNGTTLTAAGLSGPHDGTVGATTPNTGSFTTLAASSTVSGTGFSTYLASPPAIGSTAANTGAFTTLTTSSTVTLNGGTANGVTYLNGSKVLTSGSALTFDGTTFSNVQASGTAALSFNQLSFSRNGANYLTATLSSLNYGASQHIFGDNTLASEWMRLTSTGLGIGTSSPATKMVVAGTDPGTLGLSYIYSTDSATQNKGGQLTFGGSYTGTSSTYFAAIAGRKESATSGNYDGYLQFLTRNAPSDMREVMRLDSAGNLGLGVTPSAWSATYKALQVGATASIWSGASGELTSLQSNAYFNGTNYIRLIAGYATGYDQTGGAHYWKIASSSSAGSTVSFTQAMTLFSSGGFSLGGTGDPGNGGMSIVGTGNAYVNPRGASGYGSFIAFTEAGVSDRYLIGCPASTNDLVFRSNAGNFVTGAERMRLTGGGDLLVGKTAISGATLGAELRADGSTWSAMSASANTTSTINVYSTGASAYRFYVGMGGTVYATSTTITAISDQRLKENIRDLDDGLDVVLALKPRKFDWKEGKGQNIKNARGFIAQEFETVLPDMIEEWRDPAPEGEEAYKAINANLIPTLVKAIQEQQAIIQQLQADVAALKG